MLTSGTSEGYSYIFRLLCEPGDEILVPAPSYPLFEFLADLADVRLVPYRCSTITAGKSISTRCEPRLRHARAPCWWCIPTIPPDHL